MSTSCTIKKRQTSDSTLPSKIVSPLSVILLEQSLRKLIKKLKKQQDLTDPSDVQLSFDREKLKGILEDHGVDFDKSSNFVEDLLVWKRQI